MKTKVFLVMVAAVIMLLVSGSFNNIACAQEVAVVDTEQAIYSGPTRFMVRDPDLGPNVYNQYNITGPLPSWWTPPSGWEVLAAGVIIAAIFPAFYDYGVSGIYFREASFIHHRFHDRRNHFHDFNRRIGPRFNSHFHSIARGRHFDPKHVRGQGIHRPGNMRQQPGRVGPPSRAGAHGPGVARQPVRVGPPPRAGAPGSGGVRQQRLAPPTRGSGAPGPGIGRQQQRPQMAPQRQMQQRPQMAPQRQMQQRPQMAPQRQMQQRPAAQPRPQPQQKRNPNQK